MKIWDLCRKSGYSSCVKCGDYTMKSRAAGSEQPFNGVMRSREKVVVFSMAYRHGRYYRFRSEALVDVVDASAAGVRR